MDRQGNKVREYIAAKGTDLSQIGPPDADVPIFHGSAGILYLR
jgi:hypothetical protein